jgi:hypothetical protein
MWERVSKSCFSLKETAAFPISQRRHYNLHANGGDRLRQGFGRPTDVMPGYSMQLVKKRREKTIANSNELALAA